MTLKFTDKITIFWFRRDLRLFDNTGLYHALQSGNPVLPIFIFDRNILDQLESRQDGRVQFIYDAVLQLKKELEQAGSSLLVLYESPLAAFQHILSAYSVHAVYCNHDYELYAQERDANVAALLESNGIKLHSFKDQVIFEKNEVLKDNQQPYTVFTPYSKKWKERLAGSMLPILDTKRLFGNLLQTSPLHCPQLEELGFQPTQYFAGPPVANLSIVRNYGAQRDFPAKNGTTGLSVHLRFGTISIRQLVNEVVHLDEAFLNELIWREFYQMILWHFPQVAHSAFKPPFNNIEWRNNEEEFNCWCRGETGYPLVDAGMKQLNTTGYMHNRVRMVTASFLTKHLLIDWRWGEAYFAARLMDFDLAANNGGWQWAAGSGCDAVPYFRIFNPTLQTQKFDPNLEYIRRFIPDFRAENYRKPIVQHEFARARCLEVFKVALGQN
jgi:deoxyribodipyrimidine photo-lyase